MVSKPFKMYTIEASRKRKGKCSIRSGTQDSLKCKEVTVFDLQGSTTEATLKCFFHPYNSLQIGMRHSTMAKDTHQ